MLHHRLESKSAFWNTRLLHYFQGKLSRTLDVYNTKYKTLTNRLRGDSESSSAEQQTYSFIDAFIDAKPQVLTLKFNSCKLRLDVWKSPRRSDKCVHLFLVTPGPLHLSRASTRSQVRLDTRKQWAATEVELRRCNYTSGRLKCFWSIPSQLLLRGELAEHQRRREEGGWRREEGVQEGLGI